MSALIQAAASLRQALAGFDPHLLSGADCGRVAEVLALTEKACAGARLLASARAVACGAHNEAGFADPAAWVARQAGGTTGQARQALDAAAGLEECPATKAALLAGELSLVQAQEITRAETEAPGVEDELLTIARNEGLGRLRDRAREHRQAHMDVQDLHRRQEAAKQFRHWRDDLGMFCFSGALVPEVGVPFGNRLELAAQRARRAAGEAGRPRERFEAYMADALVALVFGTHRVPGTEHQRVAEQSARGECIGEERVAAGRVGEAGATAGGPQHVGVNGKSGAVPRAELRQAGSGPPKATGVPDDFPQVARGPCQTGSEPELSAAAISTPAVADGFREVAKGGRDVAKGGRDVADGFPNVAGGRPVRAELVLVCDLYAWRRGHTHPGEACHVIGGGPLPVELAHELSRDAFIKAVLHDGRAIHTIKHFGRHLSAELRSALDLGPVPAFSGAQCAKCGRRYGLEYDHIDPLANRGPTAYENLQALCWEDHQAKTEQDRKAGLLEPGPP